MRIHPVQLCGLQVRIMQIPELPAGGMRNQRYQAGQLPVPGSKIPEIQGHRVRLDEGDSYRKPGV
jgi:hypothetical protein